MCEFDVFKNGEKIFEEAVYLKRHRDEDNVVARDILGNEMDLGNVKIKEIDVSSEKLTVSST